MGNKQKLDPAIADKFSDFLEQYSNNPDTYNEIVEYFKSVSKPIDSDYYELALYFLDENKNIKLASESDKCYKKWLEDLIKNDKESESVVLSLLKKEYQNKADLEKFIFALNGLDIELNQKWHFFISYWGYREYVTLYPENNCGFPVIKDNIYNPFQCKELNTWCDLSKIRCDLP